MDRRFAYQAYQFRPGTPGSWRTWAGLALGGAAVAALLLVFGLVFLLLVPVFAVAGLVGRWWLGRKLREATEAQRRRSGVIEGQYEVIEVDAVPGRRESSSPWRH
ncbi:MAG: hypothetical protein U1E14_02770 [Geminicoccaceae bacterium]